MLPVLDAEAVLHADSIDGGGAWRMSNACNDRSNEEGQELELYLPPALLIHGDSKSDLELDRHARRFHRWRDIATSIADTTRLLDIPAPAD